MTTPRIYKTEAIVLRQRKLGEAGKIVTLYTPNYGKLDAVAKGVRRPKSRLGGHLEVLTHTAVMLAQGRNLDTVTQAQTVESFAGLRADLHRLSRALYAAELVDRFSPEGAESYPVFQLLLATLRRLATARNVDTVVRYLEMQLLGVAGFQPQLARCLLFQAFPLDKYCPQGIPQQFSQELYSPNLLISSKLGRFLSYPLNLQ